MTIPDWIQKRYLALRNNFKERSFKFSEAALFLNQKFKDSKEQAKVILSELKKAKLLKYYTSGDITEDYKNSVGYASIEIT